MCVPGACRTGYSGSAEHVDRSSDSGGADRGGVPGRWRGDDVLDGSGGFFTWWCGWNAFRSGCEILACVVPAILEAIADASKSNHTGHGDGWHRSRALSRCGRGADRAGSQVLHHRRRP